MNEQKLYLKPNVVIEPLFNRWYAWTHLISPVTSAMNIVDRHLNIIDSYLMAPEIHAQAVANPKMLGGPFMDFDGDKSEQVKVLKTKTLENCQNQISLARALKELDNLLHSKANGAGLEGLYGQVPEILKGYVELFYDRQNNASFRIYESLFYNSKYYNKDLQSIALWVTNNDERPFALSTPKLDGPDILHLNIPFEHPAIDDLAKMKRNPQTLSFIKEKMGINDDQLSLFETFFSQTPPPEYNKYTGEKIRMRYFGHACILVETKDISILVDPLISYYGYHSDVNHYSDADLPEEIDYVIITHNHQDHILFETLLPLRHKVKNLVVPRTRGGRLEDPELKQMFSHMGFENVTEIDEMEVVNFGDVSITAIPFTGEHSDLNIQSKACYQLRIGEFKLMYMADSRVLEPAIYEHVHAITGDVDVIFLGMECDGAPLSWLYGPLLPRKLNREQDSSRRLAGSDCAKGLVLVDIFNPTELYVYAMGQEPWLEFISSIKYTDESNPIMQSNKLIDICRTRGISAERLFGEKELFYNRIMQEA